MRYSPADGVTAERSGERMVVLDAAGKELITLSPVGALVWSQLPADFSAILEELSEQFAEVAESTLTADLEAFLTELDEAGLVVATDAAR